MGRFFGFKYIALLWLLVAPTGLSVGCGFDVFSVDPANGGTLTVTPTITTTLVQTFGISVIPGSSCLGEMVFDATLSFNSKQSVLPTKLTFPVSTDSATVKVTWTDVSSLTPQVVKLVLGITNTEATQTIEPTYSLTITTPKPTNADVITTSTVPKPTTSTSKTTSSSYTSSSHSASTAKSSAAHSFATPATTTSKSSSTSSFTNLSVSHEIVVTIFCALGMLFIAMV